MPLLRRRPITTSVSDAEPNCPSGTSVFPYEKHSRRIAILALVVTEPQATRLEDNDENVMRIDFMRKQETGKKSAKRRIRRI
jgi:hypothetical protein